MKKMLLINPCNPLNGLFQSGVVRRMTMGRKAVFMPVGLMVAAGVMPSDWQVELIDEGIKPLKIDRNVDLVGITAMTCQAKRAYEIADAYRRLGVPVILGGVHPSVMPAEALEHATAVAVGEAEGTLPRMLRDLEAGQLGGVYRADGRSEFACPRRDVIDPRDYLIADGVQVSRGCPHNCRFCTTWAIYQGRYTARPIEAICQEISEMKTRRVTVVDDNLFGDPRWARDLFRAMRKLRVRWMGQAPITIARDDETLGLLKESGCLCLFLGLESPNADTLAEGRKTFCRPEDYIPLIRRLHRAGVGTWGSLIFGFDTDTVQSIRQTVRFTRRAKLGIAIFPILTPYPGTPLFEEFEADGRLLTRDWSKYTAGSVVFQPKRMTPRQLADCQLAAFREFNSLPSMAQRFRPMGFVKWSLLVNACFYMANRYFWLKQGARWPKFSEIEHG